MRRISIKRCKPGMQLFKPIYNDIGLVLIGKDVELTQSLIDRLINLGIDSVYIKDPRTDDLYIEDTLSDKTSELALKTIKQTFQEMFNNQMVNRSFHKKDLSITFKTVLNHMLHDLKSNNNAMVMLSNIFVKDLYLYTHSLQVGVYSISIGLAKGYNQQQLIELGLGALLHDIGKTKIPISILEKKGPLTDEEYDIVKKHTIYGFDILRNEEGIPLLSAHCAYQHHERLNGSGYPRALNDKDVHEYAKIVAIADVYDALITKRVYRKPILPHQALEYLYTKADDEFDKELLKLFRKTVAIYPIGVEVTLNSGESGVVIDINNNFTDRPIIRVLQKDNKDIDIPYEIDLSKEFSLTIIDCSCI